MNIYIVKKKTLNSKEKLSTLFPLSTTLFLNIVPHNYNGGAGENKVITFSFVGLFEEVEESQEFLEFDIKPQVIFVGKVPRVSTNRYT